MSNKKEESVIIDEISHDVKYLRFNLHIDDFLDLVNAANKKDISVSEYIYSLIFKGRKFSKSINKNGIVFMTCLDGTEYFISDQVKIRLSCNAELFKEIVDAANSYDLSTNMYINAIVNGYVLPKKQSDIKNCVTLELSEEEERYLISSTNLLSISIQDFIKTLIKNNMKSKS